MAPERNNASVPKKESAPVAIPATTANKALMTRHSMRDERHIGMIRLANETVLAIISILASFSPMTLFTVAPKTAETMKAAIVNTIFKVMVPTPFIDSTFLSKKFSTFLTYLFLGYFTFVPDPRKSEKKFV